MVRAGGSLWLMGGGHHDQYNNNLYALVHLWCSEVVRRAYVARRGVGGPLRVWARSWLSIADAVTWWVWVGAGTL